MNKEGVLFVLMVFFIGCSVGSAISAWGATSIQRKYAIEAGVGAWTIDAKTGQSEFVYGARQP